MPFRTASGKLPLVLSVWGTLWIGNDLGFRRYRRVYLHLLVQVFRISVSHLRVLENIPQDFCHLHWMYFCCMGFGFVLYSPLSLYSTWRHNGSGALVHPGKQAATAGKRFVSYFLDCPHCQTEGFSHPIYITTKCYSSY